MIVRKKYINYSLVKRLTKLKNSFEILSVIFIILDLILYVLIHILDFMSSIVINMNRLVIQIILV